MQSILLGIKTKLREVLDPRYWANIDLWGVNIFQIFLQDPIKISENAK